MVVCCLLLLFLLFLFILQVVPVSEGSVFVTLLLYCVFVFCLADIISILKRKRNATISKMVVPSFSTRKVKHPTFLKSQS